MQMATSKIENSAQVLSCQLKFVHCFNQLTVQYNKQYSKFCQKKTRSSLDSRKSSLGFRRGDVTTNHKTLHEFYYSLIKQSQHRCLLNNYLQRALSCLYIGEVCHENWRETDIFQKQAFWLGQIYQLEQPNTVALLPSLYIMNT